MAGAAMPKVNPMIIGMLSIGRAKVSTNHDNFHAASNPAADYILAATVLVLKGDSGIRTRFGGVFA